MFDLNDLFGGAICAHLPQYRTDISKVRQVPDNQEVFAHTSTDQSIIFDILEYVTEVSDSQAIEFHFKELVGDSTEAKIVSINKLETKLEDVDSVYYLNGQHFISKYKESAKNLVDIHMALFRLKKYDTDILITFNDPIHIDPQSSSYEATSGADLSQKWTFQNFKQLVDTFRIVDYKLFGN